MSEGDRSDISNADLIAISPSGVIHLELLKNISYISAVSEDTFYRENQTAKSISDHLTGNSGYPIDSKQSDLIKVSILIDYLVAYQKSHFFELDDIINTNELSRESSLEHISDFYRMKIENDPKLSERHNLVTKYPKGTVIQTQILSIQSYGFFVDIGLDASGLVHISQIPGKSSTLYDFEEGDWVDVEIIDYQTQHSKFECKLLNAVNSKQSKN